MSLQRIIEIANETKQMDLVQKLEEINKVLNTTNAPLVLPLVGEFSSGKTTLLNALTDSKKLETATKPTTATIYKVFFGNEKSYASIIKEDGTVTEVSDIAELKNDKLNDAALVEVYDTASKISSSTVLVDTPGLSSPNLKHKEVLIDFIPKADGILLVTDINQQITKSLVDFAKTIAISERPVYLVITKCDTKSDAEIQSVKEYIRKNSELKIEDIVCVSSYKQDLAELYNLLNTIDNNKCDILKKVNKQRTSNIISILLERIDELISSLDKADSLEQELQSQKRELEKIKRNIDKLLNDVSLQIDDIEKDACRRFKDLAFERLESIALSNIDNYDNQAQTEINGIANQFLEKYKQNVQSLIYKTSNERRNSELEVNLLSLRDINLSDIKISELPYNLNLNAVGHEYDSVIAGAVKIGAVAAIVAAAVYAAPVLAEAAAEAGIAEGIAGSVDAMVVAGASALNNAQKNKEIELLNQQKLLEQNRVKIEKNELMKEELKNQLTDTDGLKQKFELVDNYNAQIGNKIGLKTGFVEGVVSKITDKTGKPQRQRIIHNYIDDCLGPSFTTQLQTVSQKLINLVSDNLNKEAEDIISQKTEILQDLINKKNNAEEAYNKEILALKNCKKELIELQGKIL